MTTLEALHVLVCHAEGDTYEAPVLKEAVAVIRPLMRSADIHASGFNMKRVIPDRDQTAHCAYCFKGVIDPVIVDGLPYHRAHRAVVARHSRL